MYNINCCKDCKKRKLGCHSDCEEYNEAKKIFSKEKSEKKLYDKEHKPIQKGRFLGDFKISKRFKRERV